MGLTKVTYSMIDGASANVFDFGAVGDGVTDDSTAIQAALNSGATSVYLPSARYYCSVGITVPPTVSLWSDDFAPSNGGSYGTALVFDLNVATCVTTGGSTANNKASTIKGFSVVRKAGTPPTGSIGVLVQNSYASLVEDIGCFNHDIGFKYQSNGDQLGIACMNNRLYTGEIYDSHVVVDSWPECRFNQCRFGSNGGIDKNCNSYIRIQGGSTTNPACGPNTVVAVNCQFNQGINKAAAFIDFKHKLAGSVNDFGLFQIDTCHIEAVDAGIKTDATINSLQRVMICNTSYISPATEFFVLNAATQINECVLSNNLIFAKLTINTTPQINFLNVNSSQFTELVSVTGAGSSVVTFSDNIYRGGLTIAGTFASGNAQFKGGSVAGGVLTYTATNATIDVGPYNYLSNWTPTLTFGGASTGITYAARSGKYSIINNVVTLYFAIELSSKGSATGNAAITGLPFNVNTNWPLTGQIIPYIVNVSGLSNVASSVISSTFNRIDLDSYGATGNTALTDANFTNTTKINGSVSYYLS